MYEISGVNNHSHTFTVVEQHHLAIVIEVGKISVTTFLYLYQNYNHYNILVKGIRGLELDWLTQAMEYGSWLLRTVV